MLRSLYAKLALVLLGLFVLIGVCFVAISVFSTEKYQQEVNQKLNRELAGLIVAEKIVLRDNRINQDALKDIFHMLMVINPSIEIYLLDPEGNILAFSAEPGKVMRKSVDLEPVKKLIGGHPALPLLGDDPRDKGGKKVFTAAPITQGARLEGYLYVILGGETYDSIIQKIQGSYILRLSIRVVAMSLLVALVAGLLIFAFLTRRLTRLAAVMDGYKSGMPPEESDLRLRISDPPDDEIDRLGATFTQMTERINQQMDKLEKSDALRRELVANVSHDLRTPLATLRGYMETLLMKDESLSAAQRRDYLQIAISHCERLGKLITDLFELAKLDAQDTVVHPESFSVRELVQDVVQKFELTAQGKHVNIVTNIGKELPFVYADIALIERVLENLIENAVRYTPEDGSVSIVMEHEDAHVRVLISDTGPGIAENDLPRIFDRFYQPDRSRKGKAGHCGLGLAITKRILELHGSSIQAQSAVNSGASFTFHLPVSPSE
ncbi:MAG TPA: sensor histidine kinase [Nitrospiraceae bacterium]|nr:sensor histidine kinase [Nitrospiraceae bacterium]